MCGISRKTEQTIHYIDKSVLVENRPLHPGLEWRIFHILTTEDIDDVISRSYTVVCAQTLVHIIKKNYTVA